MKTTFSWICTLGLGLAAPICAAPAEVEIGGEYQLALIHTDDGLNLEAKQTKETDFAIRAAKIALRGKLSDQISWNVLFMADKSELERYWLTNKVSDNFDVAIGQQKIKVYGWHRRLSSSAVSPVRGAVLDYNPLKDKMAVDLTYKLAGTFSLSFIKDYFDTSTTCQADGTGCKSWNGKDVQKQPAVAFEWIGAFGEIQPLVQFANYDRGNSSTASAGVRYKTDTLDTYVDFTQDTRNEKGVGASGKAEDLKNTITGLAIYGEWKLEGGYTPFWHISTLGVDQYTAPGQKQRQTNENGKLDDNEQTAALGLWFDLWGTYYRPYVAVARYAGDYADPEDASKTEQRTKLDVLTGITGKF